MTSALPGFTGDASLYRSRTNYRHGSRSPGAATHVRFALHPAARPASCKAGCGPCVPDSTSSTGCSHTCFTAPPACEDTTHPCACPATCATGWLRCSGKCVNPANDPTNCGGCAIKCESGACVASKCLPCGPGQSPCGTQCCPTGECCGSTGLCKCAGNCCAKNELCCPATGCTNISSDPNNCGSCGNICPTPANSTPTCVPGSNPYASTCSFTCNTSYTRCSSACVDLAHRSAKLRELRTINVTGGMICQGGLRLPIRPNQLQRRLQKPAYRFPELRELRTSMHRRHDLPRWHLRLPARRNQLQRHLQEPAYRFRRTAGAADINAPAA